MVYMCGEKKWEQVEKEDICVRCGGRRVRPKWRWKDRVKIILNAWGLNMQGSKACIGESESE